MTEPWGGGPTPPPDDSPTTKIQVGPSQDALHLGEQFTSLAKLVRDLQEEVKKNSLKRDYLARIFALIIILSVMAGAIIVQQVSASNQRQNAIADCNAINEQLRSQRALYQSLISAEQQIPSTSGSNISIKQTRIAAYNQALSNIKLLDCTKY
jgi:hypothetical protein